MLNLVEYRVYHNAIWDRPKPRLSRFRNYAKYSDINPDIGHVLSAKFCSSGIFRVLPGLRVQSCTFLFILTSEKRLKSCKSRGQYRRRCPYDYFCYSIFNGSSAWPARNCGKCFKICFRENFRKNLAFALSKIKSEYSKWHFWMSNLLDVS